MHISNGAWQNWHHIGIIPVFHTTEVRYRLTLNYLGYKCVYVCQTHCPKYKPQSSWWRHQMETYSALLALCVRNPPVTHTHTTPTSPPPHPTHHHTPTPPPYESWSFSHCITYFTYHQASNIRRNKCQRLNVYCLVVQLYLSIDWSHVLSQEWICSWSSADRRVNDWTAIGIAELSTHL